jgi:hypothetical protein
MKKIVLGTLLVGLIGILVVGAAIRTMDKTGNVAEARGAEDAGWRGGQGGTAQTVQAGAGQGRNQGQGSGTLALEGATAAEDWISYEGTVVQAPTAGVDMVLATDEGEEIVIGTGPGYLDEMGLSLQVGEQVQVQGYWEDDEFKAGQLTRLRDGATVSLRDTYGRPAWSGAGQRQNAAAVVTASEAATQATRRQAAGRAAAGQGVTGQAAGQGSGQGAAVQPYAQGDLDSPGTGQAEVEDWLTLAGSVSVANDDELVVQIDGGAEVVIEGRALRFLQEQGFQVQVGQRLSLTGFYEGDDFEVGAVENLTTRLSVQVRDQDGRPLWAGRGSRTS